MWRHAPERLAADNNGPTCGVASEAAVLPLAGRSLPDLIVESVQRVARLTGDLP